MAFWRWPAMTSVSAELLDAYRRTNYRVLEGVSPFVMRVDEPCEPLRRCHEAFGVRCSSFITAWNPRSTPTPRAINDAAMDRLSHDVAALGLRTLPGVGVDPDGTWEGEPSLLVLGLDVPAALTLARAYGQHAIVCAGPDAVPRLVIATV